MRTARWAAAVGLIFTACSTAGAPSGIGAGATMPPGTATAAAGRPAPSSSGAAKRADSTSPVPVAPCRLADLEVGDLEWGGATGNAVGFVLLTDASPAPCSLQGHPRAVTILGQDGNPIPLRFGYVGDTAGGAVDPFVVLEPGLGPPSPAGPGPGRALVILMWGKTCPDIPSKAIEITLPDGESFEAAVTGPMRSPGCNTPEQPGDLSADWIQPSR